LAYRHDQVTAQAPALRGILSPPAWILVKAPIWPWLRREAPRNLRQGWDRAGRQWSRLSQEKETVPSPPVGISACGRWPACSEGTLSAAGAVAGACRRLAALMGIW